MVFASLVAGWPALLLGMLLGPLFFRAIALEFLSSNRWGWFICTLNFFCVVVGELWRDMRKDN